MFFFVLFCFFVFFFLGGGLVGEGGRCRVEGVGVGWGEVSS